MQARFLRRSQRQVRCLRCWMPKLHECHCLLNLRHWIITQRRRQLFLQTRNHSGFLLGQSLLPTLRHQLRLVLGVSHQLHFLQNRLHQVAHQQHLRLQPGNLPLRRRHSVLQLHQQLSQLSQLHLLLQLRRRLHLRRLSPAVHSQLRRRQIQRRLRVQGLSCRMLQLLHRVHLLFLLAWLQHVRWLMSVRLS